MLDLLMKLRRAVARGIEEALAYAEMVSVIGRVFEDPDEEE